MSKLTFVTGNAEKFSIAAHAFSKHGIDLLQAVLDVDEIQEEDAERIARVKVQAAFETIKQPVVINDDSWSIPGLRGFPGPYMKSINHWFTAEDFLNLTRDLEDRRIILTQRIAYQDDSEQKVVTLSYTGSLLPETRGSYGSGLQKVITMPGDDGLSIAEAYDRGTSIAAREVVEGWEAFIAWYKGAKL